MALQYVFNVFSGKLGPVQNLGNLPDIIGITPSDGTIIIGNGTDWVAGTLPYQMIDLAAASLELVETSSAVPVRIAGSNKTKDLLAFSDSTEEYANFSFRVHDRIATAGTVTVVYIVQAKTFVSSKNIALTFGHSAVADDEDYDVAYTDLDTGDLAVEGAQDDILVFTDTETVSNLGWIAGDQVDCRVSRPAASADNLADDLYLHRICLLVPLGR